MPVFAFYHFNIEKVHHDGELDFPNEDEQCTDGEELFESEFPEGAEGIKLKVPNRKYNVDFNSDGAYDIYSADVLANYDNILILTLENNKVKHTIVDKIDISHDHHPYAYLIFDYRPGHRFLAIQKSAAFDNKPDKVREIISIAFNKIFSHSDCKITLVPYKKPFVDFWEAINTIRTRLKDRIQKICLDFTNSAALTDTSSCEIASILADISRRAEANGLWSLEANEGSEVNIDAIHEDLVNIANICIEEGQYDLSFHFRSYGIYRYGSEVSAQYGVEWELIQAYLDRLDNYDLFGEHHSLKNWLDNMINLHEDYEYEAPVSRPTKQGDRR